MAIREAIINAVTHRDIENPGGLYSGLTVADLGHRSVRRNRLIADLLRRAGYIERVGSGFERMREELLKNNNPPLEVSVTNFFNIRFFKRIPNMNLEQLTPRQLTIYYSFVDQKKLTKKILF